MTTNLCIPRNGWNNPAYENKATGMSTSFTRLVSLFASLSVVIGTGVNTLTQIQQIPSRMVLTSPKLYIEESGNLVLKTPHEDLELIRKVLKPSVSEFAITMGVTRQTIYNWINGDTITEDHANNLRNLAAAAQMLEATGILLTSSLLKRKFSNGKTLFQVAQSGEGVLAAAEKLVQIYSAESEQRMKLNSRLTSKNLSSSSADFDLPLSNS